MDTQEKRQHPRFKVLQLVAFINREGGVQRTPVSMGRTLDISEGGARVEVFEPLHVGSRMEMDIAAGEDSCSVSGVVTHCETDTDGSHIVGIEFDSPGEALINILA